jgi:uncharacterized OB-fold protein
MSNIINLADRRRPKQESEPGTGVRCKRCGSGWFTVRGICLDQEPGTTGWEGLKIGGFAGLPACADCGEMYIPEGEA